MRLSAIDHEFDANHVCEKFGLDSSEFQQTFVEISRQWIAEMRSSSQYHICLFVNAGILNICKTPEDFQQVSNILLPYYSDIASNADGSFQFARAIFKELEAGRITSIEMFGQVCRRTFEQNREIFGITGEPRDGSQYPEYVSVAIREAVEQAQGDAL